MDEVRLIDANRFKRILKRLEKRLTVYGAIEKAKIVSRIIKWLDTQPTVCIKEKEK